MDGENNGKPYEQMDDLGVPLLLETPISSRIFPIKGGKHSAKERTPWKPEPLQGGPLLVTNGVITSLIDE